MLKIKNLHSSMVRLETRMEKTMILHHKHLHSSMVRLETCSTKKSSRLRKSIYIPVWLDQKRIYGAQAKEGALDLHSSMVRLETISMDLFGLGSMLFTFQYGQIRNEPSEYYSLF